MAVPLAAQAPLSEELDGQLDVLLRLDGLDRIRRVLDDFELSTMNRVAHSAFVVVSEVGDNDGSARALRIAPRPPTGTARRSVLETLNHVPPRPASITYQRTTYTSRIASHNRSRSTLF